MSKRLIISVSGLIGSGKDTIGNYLVHEHGFTRMSFSAALKDVVAAVFHWDRNLLDGLTPEAREWRETPDPWWTQKLDLGLQVTPRWALVNIGTDVMRDHFHQDIWRLSLQRKIMDFRGDVVLTDTRFMNELSLVRELGGSITGVYRKTPEWLKDFYSGVENLLFWQCVKDPFDAHPNQLIPAGKEMISRLDVKVHESEWQHLLWTDYDHVFNNNRSIQDLESAVDKFVASISED